MSARWQGLPIGTSRVFEGNQHRVFLRADSRCSSPWEVEDECCGVGEARQRARTRGRQQLQGERTAHVQMINNTSWHTKQLHRLNI